MSIEKDAEKIIDEFSKTLDNIPDSEETWYITDNLNLTYCCPFSLLTSIFPVFLPYNSNHIFFYRSFPTLFFSRCPLPLSFR